MDSTLDDIFFALSDGTRRDILSRLATGEKNVGELAGQYAMSGPAITKHLKVLERAGLLERRKEGQWRRCSLNASALAAADHWIGQYRQFWQQSFDRLAGYLDELQTENHDGTMKGDGDE